MSPQNQPPKLSFVARATMFQKWVATIAGSMAIATAATYIHYVERIFDPLFLSYLRQFMAGIALVSGGFVGIPAIKEMVSWLFDFYEFYKKFKSDK